MKSDVPMSAVLANTTLTVRLTGRRRARVRIWVGSKVLRLGAAIIGSEIVIDLTETAEKTSETHDCCATTHDNGPLPSD